MYRSAMFSRIYFNRFLPWWALHSQVLRHRSQCLQLWACKSWNCWYYAVPSCNYQQLPYSNAFREYTHHLSHKSLQFFSEFWPHCSSYWKQYRDWSNFLRILCILSDFKCTCSVNFFLYIRSLKIIISCLTTFTGLITFYTLNISFSRIIPSFC